MNWYDNLTDEQITQLKENKTPLGLCEEWMQEAFLELRKISVAEDFDYLKHYCGTGPGWLYPGFPELQSEYGYSNTTFRLIPDWQRPELEDIKFTECKILLRETSWIPFVDMDRDGVKIDVELTERRCPVCGKEWLTLWLNDQVVYGGHCSLFRDGRRIENCGCMVGLGK